LTGARRHRVLAPACGQAPYGCPCPPRLAHTRVTGCRRRHKLLPPPPHQQGGVLRRRLEVGAAGAGRQGTGLGVSFGLARLACACRWACVLTGAHGLFNLLLLGSEGPARRGVED